MKVFHTLRLFFVFAVVIVFLSGALAFAQGPDVPQPFPKSADHAVPSSVFIDERSPGGLANDALTVESASGYRAERMPKPADFTSLEAWVASHYDNDDNSRISFLPSTVRRVSLEYGEDMGKPTIMFETLEQGEYTLNAVVDAGESLHLYALKDPGFDVNQIETGPVTERSQGPTSVSGCNACNCVLWVRCAKAPWLPYGLTTLDDKRRAINSSTAQTGRVAVHNISYPWGHVSYVTGVSGDRIYIQEANYRACQVTSRSGTKSDLKIIGYIKK